jgi:hypothetical protein
VCAGKFAGRSYINICILVRIGVTKLRGQYSRVFPLGTEGVLVTRVRFDYVRSFSPEGGEPLLLCVGRERDVPRVHRLADDFQGVAWLLPVGFG